MLHTAKKRDSIENIQDWRAILKVVREEPKLYLLWDDYITENPNIGELEFHVILDSVDELAKQLDF